MSVRSYTPGRMTEESRTTRHFINRSNPKTPPENPESKTQRRKRNMAAHGGQRAHRSKGGGLNSHWGGFINTKIVKTDPLYPMGHSKDQHMDA